MCCRRARIWSKAAARSKPSGNRRPQQVGDAKLVTVDVQRLGPRAVREIGTVTLQTKAQPPQQIVGKYVVVWHRIGRHWLLSTDIWNSNK